MATPKTKPTMTVVTNHRPTILTTPGTRGFPARPLGPGVNHIPLEELEDLMDLDPKSGPGKVWRMWLDLRYITVPGSKAEAERMAREPAGVKPPTTIANRKVEAALAMVAVEGNGDTLRMWYASDARKEVRAAISAKLSGGTSEDASEGAGGTE